MATVSQAQDPAGPGARRRRVVESDAETVRDRVLAHLQRDRESIVDLAWRRVLSVTPADVELGELQHGEVRSGVHQVFELFVSCLEQDRGLTADELTAMQVVGVARARQGFRLSVIQCRFRVAFEVCYGEMLAAARAEADAGVAAGIIADVVGELSASLVDLAFDALEAIAAGHWDQTQDRALHQIHWESAVVESVLEGGREEGELQRLVHLTERDVELPAAIVVLVPVMAANASEVLALSSGLAAMLPDALTGYVRTQSPAHAVLLVGGAHPDALNAPGGLRSQLEQFGREHGAALLLAVGSRLAALGEVYRSLRTSVDLLPRVAGGGGVVGTSDLRLYQTLAGIGDEVAATFVGQELGPIMRLPVEQRDPLLDLLRAMMDGDGTLAQAAEQLMLHPKGAAHRARRIAQLTGRNPAVPADWFRLGLAISLMRVHAAVAQPQRDYTTVTFADEVTVDQTLAVADEAAVASLVQQELGPVLRLPPGQRDRLLATLGAMVDGDGTVADAARQLGLRPSGVAYRNRRICELTGRNPAVPADWFRLLVVTRLLRQHPQVTAPTSDDSHS